MTKIADALAPFYADATNTFSSPEAKYKFEETFLGSRLRDWLNGAATSHAGWQFFNMTWRRFAGMDADDTYSPVHPDVLVACCESLGFTEIEPLAAWIESLHPVMDGRVKTLSSMSSSNVSLPYESMPDYAASDIMAILSAEGNIDLNVTVRQCDDEYKLLSRADLNAILKACPSKKMQYRAQRRDCEDFSYQMKAWLGYLGYSNVTLGICDMRLYDKDGNVTGAHSCNWVVYKDTDGKIKAGLIEPQNNQLHGMKEAWLGSGIGGASVRNEIYWIEI